MTKQTASQRSETNFTRMVDEDILRCEAFLCGARDEKTGEELHIELVAKYPSYIAHFGDYLRKFNSERGFVMMEYFDRDSLVHDLIVMKSRLVAFKNHGYRNSSLTAGAGSRNSKSTAPAPAGGDAPASYEDIRQRVREMTGLTGAKTSDVLEKVDAIEQVARLDAPKKAKWQEVRPILAWLADESVDVGAAMLPLILKIDE